MHVSRYVGIYSCTYACMYASAMHACQRITVIIAGSHGAGNYGMCLVCLEVAQCCLGLDRHLGSRRARFRNASLFCETQRFRL